jgi:hypothetical protein
MHDVKGLPTLGGFVPGAVCNIYVSEELSLFK